MDKKQLRKQYTGQRILLTYDDVHQKSELIAEATISTINWKGCRRLHTYEASREWNEVDTARILLYARTYWPKIDIIVAPTHRDDPMPEGEYDVVIVPVLGFDAHNTRLGLGAGWYDRFLASQPHAHTIGLAYDLSEAEHLPRELHDIPLKTIVTETRIVHLGT